MLYEFDGYKPVIHESAYVHPLAVITGNVVIGKKVYIAPGAAIRGDWGKIVIKDGCNVQENCTIHMFPGVTVVLEKNAHIGHGAVIHGGHIGRNCLVGMNAVIMDRVELGEECIVGALALLTEGMKIPKQKLVVGNPARIIKEVSDEMSQWKSKGTELYQKLSGQLHETLQECEALREEPEGRPTQSEKYKTWKESNQDYS